MYEYSLKFRFVFLKEVTRPREVLGNTIWYLGNYNVKLGWTLGDRDSEKILVEEICSYTYGKFF